MLSEILKLFRENDGPEDLGRLVRELGVEQSALEGMLQTLVRQGKLREISPGSETCTDCPHIPGCTYLRAGEKGGKVYELIKESG